MHLLTQAVTRLGQHIVVGIRQHDGVARTGENLSDAMPHQAGGKPSAQQRLEGAPPHMCRHLAELSHDPAAPGAL